MNPQIQERQDGCDIVNTAHSHRSPPHIWRSLLHRFYRPFLLRVLVEKMRNYKVIRVVRKLKLSLNLQTCTYLYRNDVHRRNIYIVHRDFNRLPQNVVSLTIYQHPTIFSNEILSIIPLLVLINRPIIPIRSLLVISTFRKNGESSRLWYATGKQELSEKDVCSWTAYVTANIWSRVLSRTSWKVCKFIIYTLKLMMWEMWRVLDIIISNPTSMCHYKYGPLINCSPSVPLRFY